MSNQHTPHRTTPERPIPEPSPDPEHRATVYHYDYDDSEWVGDDLSAGEPVDLFDADGNPVARIVVADDHPDTSIDSQLNARDTPNMSD